MLRRSIPALAVAALCTLAAARAEAQPRTSSGTLGNQGQLVLSAERLYGIYFTHDKDDDSNRLRESDNTSISFLMPPSIGSTAVAVAAVPRIGVDYLPINILTVGASAGIFSSSGKFKSTAKPSGVVVEDDNPDLSGYVFGPRVGGAIAINDIFTIWPRGGLTFYSAKSKSFDVNNNGVRRDTTVSSSGVLLEVECVFAIMPAHNFGFGFAPLISLPLSGTDKVESSANGTTTSVENDHSTRTLGITGSVLGFF